MSEMIVKEFLCDVFLCVLSFEYPGFRMINLTAMFLIFFLGNFCVKEFLC